MNIAAIYLKTHDHLFSLNNSEKEFSYIIVEMHNELALVYIVPQQIIVSANFIEFLLFYPFEKESFCSDYKGLIKGHWKNLEKYNVMQ